MIYKATLPALNEQNYAAHDIKDDEYVMTSHFHIFDNFFTTKINEFCPASAQGTSLMTIEFGKTEKVYLRKLDNLDNVFIDENFGKYFGFSTAFSKKSLDNNKCVAGLIYNIGTMDTQRAIALKKNVNFPSKDDKSLSTTETIPAPYDDMDVEVLRKLGVLTELQKSKRFDINNAMMDYYLYGRL